MLESLLADREILYFVFADGCSACEAARPELQRFIAKHPGLTVLEIRADGPWPETFGIKIKATPAYVLRHGDEMVKTEGAMKAKEVEAWIRKAGGRL